MVASTPTRVPRDPRPGDLPVATARGLLALLLTLNAIAHLYRIDAPPGGFHTWRESDTAAVAEAYLRETRDLFAPRTHQRGATDGVTGMEFPVYNLAVGVSWRALGFHHAVPRALSLALATLGLLGVHALGRRMLGRRGALIAVFLAACSPLFFFYSRKIQPDILLPGAMAWALFLFLRGEERGGWYDRAGALALTALAAMVKPTALAIGVPMLAHVLTRGTGPTPLARLRPWHALFAAVAIGAPAAWFAHARALADQSGLHVFYLQGDLLALWRRTPWEVFLSKGCVSWPLELGMGVPAALALAAGWLVRRRPDPRVAPVGWWILGGYLSFLLVSEAVTNYHDYYGLVLVPAFALVVAAAVEALLAAPARAARAFAVVALAAAPAVAWGRIHQRYDGIPEREFHALRARVDRVIPRDARITAEDPTPAIELYRLGRHGWTFAPGASDSLVLAQHAAGAAYLVTRGRTLSPALAARVDVVDRFGDRTIARFVDPTGTAAGPP